MAEVLFSLISLAGIMIFAFIPVIVILKILEVFAGRANRVKKKF